MTRIRSQQPVLPSLLDRLIDDAPVQQKEVAKPAPVVLRDAKANIRRDLENLLNTRLHQQYPLERYPELKQSTINYGLPDFSSVLLGAAEHREVFRLTIERTIKHFEPRLQRARVQITTAGEEHERTLHIQITALLMVEPDPVPLLFDSRIRALDRIMKLRELRHG